MEVDVSIIIVNYNTKDFLYNCLTSIFSQTKDISFEVIVSDNGSKDGSIQMTKKFFPSVILLENNANLGFGAANNRGLKIAKGKYIFYLNSDTVLLNNAIKYFFDYFEIHSEDKLGAIGCNLVDNDFNLTHSFGDFPTYKNEVKYRLSNFFKLCIKKVIFSIGKSYKKKVNSIPEFFVGNVDYITGADLFLLNNDFALFDERYFLYYEETDLQLKMAKNNFERRIIEGPKIQHLCKALNESKNDIELQKNFSHIQSDKSSIKYFSKNLNPTKSSKCIFLKMIIKLTWIIAGVKNENLI